MFLNPYSRDFDFPKGNIEGAISCPRAHYIHKYIVLSSVEAVKL